ncbi:MAG: diguanylate cyclase [Thermomicrobiales bacterium]
MAKDLLAAFQSPFSIGGREIFVPPSIGIVVAGNDERDPETLVRDADTAMYRAKRRGQGALRALQAALKLAHISAWSWRMISDGRSLRTNSCCTTSRSTTWRPGRLRRRGIVAVAAPDPWVSSPPQDVILIAEETGLIVSLGRCGFSGRRAGIGSELAGIPSRS